MDMPRRVLAGAAPGVATLLLVLSVACGGSQYGDKKNFNFADASPNTLASGSPSPAAAADPTPAPVQQQATPVPVTRATPTPRPPAATPVPVQQQATFAITINSDTSGQPALNPSAARVYTGTVITWTNHDTVARSVVASGYFDSGPIAPGATFKWTAASVAAIDYHDGTRPYVVGHIDVIAR